MAPRTAEIRPDDRPDDQQVLCITRRYAAPCEKVWHAWTDPRALSHWFGPGEPNSVTRADMDVREGGRYCIHFTTPDGEDHGVSGVYKEVVAHRRLVFSWAWQSTPERVSRVTVELSPVDEGCEMRFVHDRFFDRPARDGHERGWTATFVKLGASLAQ